MWPATSWTRRSTNPPRDRSAPMTSCSASGQPWPRRHSAMAHRCGFAPSSLLRRLQRRQASPRSYCADGRPWSWARLPRKTASASPEARDRLMADLALCSSSSSTRIFPRSTGCWYVTSPIRRTTQVYFITQPNENRMRGVIQLIYRAGAEPARRVPSLYPRDRRCDPHRHGGRRSVSHAARRRR